eukprot:gnl/MRDRNA2_/MRDRNA2_337490_c0_seq1.p1 gnl/MRDRNA2_/MRDRNA2_337490_c0~~gnl/MRDRNA2_/MRDRNA2_337490_c0_seq1.p1  ORF type:complete len:106 (+),score=4.18 gnl/MRDRNA2_/MRDRNA2_337490_c0_seq1:47-319(+)
MSSATKSTTSVKSFSHPFLQDTIDRRSTGRLFKGAKVLIPTKQRIPLCVPFLHTGIINQVSCLAVPLSSYGDLYETSILGNQKQQPHLNT